MLNSAGSGDLQDLEGHISMLSANKVKGMDSAQVPCRDAIYLVIAPHEGMKVPPVKQAVKDQAKNAAKGKKT